MRVSRRYKGEHAHLFFWVVPFLFLRKELILTSEWKGATIMKIIWLSALYQLKTAGVLIGLTVFFLCSPFLSGSTRAASCSLPNNPDYGSNIGFEYVA